MLVAILCLALAPSERLDQEAYIIDRFTRRQLRMAVVSDPRVASGPATVGAFDIPRSAR